MLVNEKRLRECLPCTACCDGWLQVIVNGEEVGSGHPCKHRADHGCGIYEERPINPCRTFKCGWIVDDSPLPDWMKPNDARVIVVFDKYIWNDQQVDAVISMEENIPRATLDWLKSYALQQERRLLITEMVVAKGDISPRTKITVIGSDAFRKGIGDLIKSGRFSLLKKNFKA